MESNGGTIVKKRLILVFCIALLSLTVFAGCSSETKETYQSVFDEYSAKIKEAAPGLVDEFKKEAEPLKGDISALATLSGEKVSKLAEISTEGGSKLASIHLKEKDDQSVYMEWSQKLINVYTEEAEAITNAYTEIAMAD